MTGTAQAKQLVLNRVFGGRQWTSRGRAKSTDGTSNVHVRYCSTDKSGSTHYKFSIYPSTLKDDYDIWICGSSERYYLLPQELIRQIYNHPNAYVDSHHLNARVASVYVDTHTVMYATPSETLDLSPYFNQTITSLAYRYQDAPSSRTLVSDNSLDPQSRTYPDEIRNNIELYEGAVKQVTINTFERSITARNRCIEHYGFDCCVCGFNFGQKYGRVGLGFTHVHHLKPLNSLSSDYKIDPIKDLRPVCPNCHAMLHRRTPPFSIKELQDIIESK